MSKACPLAKRLCWGIAPPPPPAPMAIAHAQYIMNTFGYWLVCLTLFLYLCLRHLCKCIQAKQTRDIFQWHSWPVALLLAATCLDIQKEHAHYSHMYIVFSSRYQHHGNRQCTEPSSQRPSTFNNRVSYRIFRKGGETI